MIKLKESLYDKLNRLPDKTYRDLKESTQKELIGTSKKLTEASYGGAYDIADNQYFTRDDLNDFADYVVDILNTLGYSKFDYNGIWLTDNVLELELIWEGYEETITQPVDMRRIKSPHDLIKRYGSKVINKAQNAFSELGADFGPHLSTNDYYDESLNETSNTQLTRQKREFETQVRNRLGVPNLIGTRSQWTPEELQRASELGCIDMIHSILAYEDNPTIDSILNNRYMRNFINELGREKVTDIARVELEHFKRATVERDVTRDSEGITYNRIRYPED